MEIHRLKFAYNRGKFKAIFKTTIRNTIEPSMMESKSLQWQIPRRTEVFEIDRDDAIVSCP